MAWRDWRGPEPRRASSSRRYCRSSRSPSCRLRISAHRREKSAPSIPLTCARSPARSARSAFAILSSSARTIVIDGGARLEAAKLHGFDRVPCIQISHLTENEQRVLRLVVNRLGEKGEWNLDELKFEFEELIVNDAPDRGVRLHP